jgi:putative transposase
VVNELRSKHKLAVLLAASELPKSVYYYHRARLEKEQSDQDIRESILSIFHQHKGRYGYRRITTELRSSGLHINHKKVQRLMGELDLKSKVRPKRYKSYRGDIGKTADNLLQRNFNADKPNQKWVTDVTEFKVGEQKVYLSPTIDLYNREVVSYEVRTSVRLPLVLDMLTDAIAKLKWHEKPIVHSDQGWQYQNSMVQNLLRANGLKQSMSRKGNCLDNAVAESFFGILKTEMYYGEKFEDANELINSIKEYIEYYNHKRIKLKLKGLSPIEYRNQALVAA